MAPADGHSLAFAGLYEFWGEHGKTVTSATILTAPSAGRAERDPRPDAAGAAARGPGAAGSIPEVDDPQDLLHTWDEAAGEHLELRPVSPRVNKVDNNGPDLLEEAEPEPEEQRLF